MVSKEAGVYTQSFEIEARTKKQASNKAFKIASDTIQGWDYIDCDDPLIQVEEVSKL